jgi:protein SCO1
MRTTPPRHWRYLLSLGLIGLLSACHRPAELPEVATLLPEARPLPAITLTGSDGLPLPLERVHGHPTLLFFGFTSCPDVCPTTLTALAAATRRLQDLPASAQPQVLFVSVDPARDTPPAIATYVQHFGDRILGGTADEATLHRLASAVGATFERPADADPTRGYAVLHSGQVYLLNRAGQLVAVFSPPHEPAAIATDVRRILTLVGDRT